LTFNFGLEAFDIPLPSIHGGGGDSAGLVGLLDQFLETTTRVLNSGGGFEWFPGIQVLATNVHPMIVHFPIAFLSVFLFLKLAELSRSGGRLREVATWMLGLGTLGAIAAATTGLIAEATVPHGADVHEIMEWHGRIGLTVASLSTLLLIGRFALRKHPSAMSSALQVFLSVLIASCLFIGADLGGFMVYGHGVGVKAVAVAEDHHHHPEEGEED